MTNGGLLAIYLSQQQELQDGCLPYINWYSNIPLAAAGAAGLLQVLYQPALR